jgi:hypothetical protein
MAGAGELCFIHHFTFKAKTANKMIKGTLFLKW